MVLPARPAHLSPEQLLGHARRVYGLALKMLGDEADAEDVAHEVLLRAARRLGRFPDGAALHGWLSDVTAAEALARRRRKLFPPRGQTPQAPAAGRGFEGRIEASIVRVLHRKSFAARLRV